MTRLRGRLRRIQQAIDIVHPDDMGFLPVSLAEQVHGAAIDPVSGFKRLEAHALYREAAASVAAAIDAAMEEELLSCD